MAKTAQRYLTEYVIAPGGTVLTLNSGVLFKSVHKVGEQLVLVVEVFNTHAPEHQVEIVQKRKNTYVHTKAKYIDSVLVGKELFHFFAQPVGVEAEDDEIVEKQPVQQKAPVRPPREEDLIFGKRVKL